MGRTTEGVGFFWEKGKKLGGAGFGVKFLLWEYDYQVKKPPIRTPTSPKQVVQKRMCEKKKSVFERGGGGGRESSSQLLTHLVRKKKRNRRIMSGEIGTRGARLHRHS